MLETLTFIYVELVHLLFGKWYYMLKEQDHQYNKCGIIIMRASICLWKSLKSFFRQAMSSTDSPSELIELAIGTRRSELNFQ